MSFDSCSEIGASVSSETTVGHSTRFCSASGLTFLPPEALVSLRFLLLRQGIWRFAPPAGIEPAQPAPEAGTLSVELWGRLKFFQNFFTKKHAPGAARTPDLRIRSPTLYPTELRARPYDFLWDNRSSQEEKPRFPFNAFQPTPVGLYCTSLPFRNRNLI
jgi:hypothetical protein